MIIEVRRSKIQVLRVVDKHIGDRLEVKTNTVIGFCCCCCTPPLASCGRPDPRLHKLSRTPTRARDPSDKSCLVSPGHSRMSIVATERLEEHSSEFRTLFRSPNSPRHEYCRAYLQRAVLGRYPPFRTPMALCSALQ
ncbi:hypothetical protein TNCV_4480711 [Trichonephila clavipes]|nr:hypothetical protein TNCV_4480711 [Trichonephila clavipes]